jgi:hypothetical protein
MQVANEITHWQLLMGDWMVTGWRLDGDLLTALEQQTRLDRNLRPVQAVLTVTAIRQLYDSYMTCSAGLNSQYTNHEGDTILRQRGCRKDLKQKANLLLHTL